MNKKDSTIDEIKSTIEQLRDEIKLKAHLGEQETKDELAKLEQKWQNFLEEYKPIISEAEKTAKNTGEALGIAADEIKAGYERIRKLF